MTKEQFAALLNGREYTKEITHDEELAARKSGLLVIFGYSDDGVELRGVINEELGAVDGATFLLTESGVLPDVDSGEGEDDVLNKHGVLDMVLARNAIAPMVKALWCATTEYSWTFETTIPHATFDIMEDDEKFCRGIVIDVRDLER